MKHYQLLAGKIDQQRAQLIGRLLFNKYDLDRKGVLDKNQCYSIFTDYCYRILNYQSPPNTEEANTMSNIFDYNKDSKVTCQDFESLAIKYLCPHLRYQNTNISSSKITMTKKYSKIVRERLQVAKRLFQKFDKDHSGYITEEQVPGIIIETYKQLGQQYTPSKQDIESWMRMTDENGDHQVSFPQFENMIVRSLEKCGIKIYE